MIDLEEIERRAAAATPGPWRKQRFVTALVAEVRELRALSRELADLAAEEILLVRDGVDMPECSRCHRSDGKHAPSCRLGNLLARMAALGKPRGGEEG